MVPLAGSGPVAWLVSGRSAAGLAGQAGRLAGWAAARPDLGAGDVAWSLAVSRSVFEHRAVVLGAGREELLAGLAAVAAGEPAAGAVTGLVPPGGAGRVVLVFPGQGSQWAGMGAELAAASPVFAARLGECAAALAPFTGWDLREVLAGAAGAPGLERADVVQPALWAVMVSLAAVWAAAGVVPDAVAGHSQGEIAAAVAAGILSLEDGARVVALRSRALRALSGLGGMASVAEPAAAVRERLAAWDGRLWVAAVNGPAATVVSGDPAALAGLAAACRAGGVRARVLPVDYASHGAPVGQLRAEILAALGPVAPRPARVPMISAMTGGYLAGPEAGAGYWYDSLRAPVEFDRAVRVLAGDGHRVFIEASPHPVLTAPVTEILQELAGGPGAPPAAVTGTLRRDDGGPARLLASLAAAHVHGAGVDWAAVLGGGERVELPTYAFQHERYWPKARAAGGDGAGTAAEARFWAAVDGGDVRALSDALAVDGRPLSEVVSALAAWRRREHGQSAAAGWRYQVTWEPVPGPAPAVLSGTWLLAVPAGQAAGLAGACAEMLAAHGARAELLEIAGGPDRGALADRISQALPDGGVSGIVSLLALDEAPLPGHPAVPAGLAGTLALVQALGDAGVTAPLWVLTRGAVAAGPATCWPARCRRRPGAWAGSRRLSTRTGGAAWPTSPRCWTSRPRPAGRRAGRLRRGPGSGPPRRDPGPAAGPRLPAAAREAVDGGRDSAGHRRDRRGRRARGPLARHPRDTAAGAGQPVRPGRPRRSRPGRRAGRGRHPGRGRRLRHRGPGPGRRPAGPDHGVRPSAGRGTARRRDRPGRPGRGDDHRRAGRGPDRQGRRRRAPGRADRGPGPGAVRAVLLRCGHLGQRPARRVRRRQRLPRRPRPAAARPRPGRHLGGVGPVGRPRHGRRPRGRPAAEAGLRAMDPEAAAAALGQVLDAGETVVTVADVDWPKFAPVFTVRRPSPLLTALPDARSALAGPADGSSDADGTSPSPLAARLAGLPRAAQHRQLTDLVRTHAAAVLGYPDPGAVEAARPFKDLGFDSLTAVELRNRLAAATGTAPPRHPRLRLPHPRKQQPNTFAASCSASVRARHRPRCGRRSAASRWRSSAWAAGSPAASPARKSCGSCSRRAGTRSLGSRRTAAGIPRLYDRDRGHAGPATRAGGFIYEAADFDAAFFGISPREALAMDPQQRLLLETALGGGGAAPASTRPRCAARRPASSPARRGPGTAPAWTKRAAGRRATC